MAEKNPKKLSKEEKDLRDAEEHFKEFQKENAEAGDMSLAEKIKHFLNVDNNASPKEIANEFKYLKEKYSRKNKENLTEEEKQNFDKVNEFIRDMRKEKGARKKRLTVEAIKEILKEDEKRLEDVRKEADAEAEKLRKEQQERKDAEDLEKAKKELEGANSTDEVPEVLSIPEASPVQEAPAKKEEKLTAWGRTKKYAKIAGNVGIGFGMTIGAIAYGLYKVASWPIKGIWRATKLFSKIGWREIKEDKQPSFKDSYNFMRYGSFDAPKEKKENK